MLRCSASAEELIRLVVSQMRAFFGTMQQPKSQTLAAAVVGRKGAKILLLACCYQEGPSEPRRQTKANNSFL
jgi:hypothetical protein